jgi:hypothetical protein
VAVGCPGRVRSLEFGATDLRLLKVVEAAATGPHVV